MIGCIILPLYDCYLCYFTRTTHDYVKDVPELESSLMPKYIMWIIYSLSMLTAVMAIFGFFAIVCMNKLMTQYFIYLKIF